MFLGVYLSACLSNCVSIHVLIHVSFCVFVCVQNISFCQSSGRCNKSHLVTAIVISCWLFVILLGWASLRS